MAFANNNSDGINMKKKTNNKSHRGNKKVNQSLLLRQGFDSLC